LIGRKEQLMDEQARQSRRLERLTWAFVGLGVVLRLFRYGRNFPCGETSRSWR